MLCNVWYPFLKSLFPVSPITTMPSIVVSIGPFYLCRLLFPLHVFCEVGAAFPLKHLFSNVALNPETFILGFWFIVPSTGDVRVASRGQESVSVASRVVSPPPPPDKAMYQLRPELWTPQIRQCISCVPSCEPPR
jgi:hypothetical protein